MGRSEERRGDRLALGILAAVVFGPVLFYVLLYAAVYVVCSLDSCFSVGL